MKDKEIKNIYTHSWILCRDKRKWTWVHDGTLCIEDFI